MPESAVPDLPEPAKTGMGWWGLGLWLGLLLVAGGSQAADIVDIQQFIVALRAETISTIPGNSQRKLLKNLNNALGALENARTMLAVGKRRGATRYITRAGEYLDNYLRRLDKLVGRGDISETTGEPLGAEARKIRNLLLE